MKKSELIELLSSASEDEVFIDSEGLLFDIEIGHEDEVFDGFYSVYPACLTLKIKKGYGNVDKMD